LAPPISVSPRRRRRVRTRLGRRIHDIRRKTEGGEQLREIFAVPLSRAEQVRN